MQIEYNFQKSPTVLPKKTFKFSSAAFKKLHFASIIKKLLFKRGFLSTASKKKSLIFEPCQKHQLECEKSQYGFCWMFLSIFPQVASKPLLSLGLLSLISPAAKIGGCRGKIGSLLIRLTHRATGTLFFKVKFLRFDINGDMERFEVNRKLSPLM